MNVGLIYLNQSTRAIPLGLICIATYVMKKDASINTKIIDINFEDVIGTIKKTRFDIIGINAMTVEYGEAIKIAHKIRRETSAPLITGGPHISTLPESLDPIFDIGVIGEGEQTMHELTQVFKRDGKFNQDNLSEVDGLVYRKEGQLFYTNPRTLVPNLDSFPIPDYSLVNRRYFQYRNLNTWGEFGIEASIITSRGCPYKCIFCSTTQLWKRVRQHSPEYVAKTVEYLVDEFNVDHIQIWDDLFTINKTRLRSMAQLFKENGMTKKVKFNCQPRTDLIDEEFCDILIDLNIPLVLFGFESGSDKILKLLKGGKVSVEQNKNAILMCVKRGIKVQGSVIFGSPGESLEDMQKTLDFIDFAIKAKADRIWSFVMTPFPATKIWEIAKERGKVSNNMDWSLLSHQNIDHPLLLDDDIPIKEFVKIFKKGRAKLNRMKWNKIRSFIKNNFWDTVKYVLSNPNAIKLTIWQVISKRE